MINLNVKVDNSSRKFGSAPYYYYSKVEHNGEIVHALFTETEVNNAMDRAILNPEDLPQTKTVNFLTWITSFFGGTNRP